MSFISTAEHWFARVAHEVKVGAVAVENFVVKNTPAIEADAKLAASLVSVANPALGSVAMQLEAGLEVVWGKAVAAIQTADAALQQNAVSVTLDKATVDSIKAVIAAIETVKPGSSVSPVK